MSAIDRPPAAIGAGAALGLAPSAQDQRAAAAGKAKEFEAVLLGQMVDLMFKCVREGGPFGGGSNEGQWKDFLAQEYGKAIANAGGIGLATRIENEIKSAIGHQEIDQ